MSINQLKSTIVKRGGLAKANRFNVFFTPPSAAIINDSIEGIALGGEGQNIINDPRDISILCETAGIPGRQITTQEYSSGHYSRKLPTGVIEEDVNMTFLLTHDYYIKRLFDNWVNQIIPMRSDGKDFTLKYPSEYKTDIVIQQLNEKHIPIYSIKLIDAFPININTIELSNTSENTVSRVSVTLSYKVAVNENIVESAGSVLEQIGDSINNLRSIF